MRILWFEFVLALRRLGRRRTQNGLMLVTFAVSLVLSLLCWSLFYNVHLQRPDFDPKGEYYVLGHAGELWASTKELTRAELEAYTAGSKDFDDVAPLAFYLSAFVKTPEGSKRVLAAFPSSRALQVVGASPLKGRLFSAADDKFGTPPSVLLSERLWRGSFGSDPDIVGKPIELGGKPATVVGVMPAAFRFPNNQDIWISYGALFESRWVPLRTALVKLKPGISKARAERDLQAILATMPPDTPARERGQRPALLSYQSFFLWSELHISAMILFALSLLFLAVSCANAANLMIIDFLGRRPEVAATLALGIPRRAAIRNVCWQVGIIALASMVVAVAVLPLVGPWVFEHIKEINGPYWMTYHFAWRDVGTALLLAGVSAIVTVIAPSLYLWLADPEKIIRDNAYASRGTSRSLWRRVLLTGQVALLTILGVSAALLVRSNLNVGPSHWGYEASRVFEAKLSVRSIRYPEEKVDQGRLATLRNALDEVRRSPDTLAAAFAENAPGYSYGPYCMYASDQATLTSGSSTGEAFFSQVTNGYFGVLQVPLVAGEDFAEDTPDDAPPYAIINASLEAKLWPGESGLNRTFYVRYPWMKKGEAPVALVVRGIVRDFQASGPRARSNDAVFTPYRTGVGISRSAVSLFVRAHAGLATFRSIEDAVHRVDPRMALYFPSTIKREIDLMLNSIRMTSGMTSLFSAAAVLLCAIGIYSLTVAQVLQSTRDFGIRMALGGEPRQLWAAFTRGHFVTVLVGVAIGLLGAAEAVHVLGSLLYGVDPHNAWTYAGVAATILVVAALACLPSLFRLRRINPADCLRSL